MRMELEPDELLDKAMQTFCPPKSAREALVLACIMVIIAPNDTVVHFADMVNSLSCRFDLTTIEAIQKEVDAFLTTGEFVVMSVVGEA
mgnify:CR=1 FL=1